MVENKPERKGRFLGTLKGSGRMVLEWKRMG